MKFIYLFLCITSASAFLHKPKIGQPNPIIPDVYKRDLMNKILLTSIGTSCGPLLYGFLDK